MKPFLRWFGIPFVIATLTWSAQAGDATNRATADVVGLTNQIARLESDWNSAHLKNDVAAVEKLCADDLSVIVPGMPPMTKASALSAMQGGRLRFVQYETSEMLIRTPAAGIAIVTGRLQRMRAMADKMVTDDLRFTKVWINQSGQWRVTAFHASPHSP